MTEETQDFVKLIDGVCYYNFPDKYLSEDYKLIDIQYHARSRTLACIFRDKDNKKIIYKPKLPENGKSLYYYKSNIFNDQVVKKYSDLNLYFKDVMDKQDENDMSTFYEADIRLDTKYAFDYYLQNKGNPKNVKLNNLYFDIEVYTYGNSEFPDPTLAKYPVNAISYSFDGKESKVILLNINGMITKDKIKELKQKFPNRISFVNNENELFDEFEYIVKKYEPNSLSGWNSNGFDIPYLINRAQALDREHFIELFGEVEVYKDNYFIPGFILHDQLLLYKDYTYTNEPSYKLETIAQKLLGEGKITYEGNLNTLYKDDILRFVEYSLTDTKLLVGIEKHCKHISLQEELRQLVGTTAKAACSTLGQVDPLFYLEMKRRGLSVINGNRHNESEEYDGAYVRQSVGGRYNYVVDFDYTSLYPSLIRTYNIGPTNYIMKMDKDLIYKYIYYHDEFMNDKRNYNVILNPIYNDKPKILSTKQIDNTIKKYNGIVNIYGTVFTGHENEKSIFSDVITDLFNRRKEYKNKRKEMEKIKEWDTAEMFNLKQQAYKILLNSIYGALANKYFRFYNIDLAASITSAGQEAIKFAGYHVEQLMKSHDYTKDDKENIKIDPQFIQKIEDKTKFLLYCDTDSLFLYLEPYLNKYNIEPTVPNIDKICKQIQNWLNKDLLIKFVKLHGIDEKYTALDLKNELIAKRYYCLNVKKKYALYLISKEGIPPKPEDEIDIKGLEIKRSDFPDLTKKMLSRIIEMILKEDKTEFEIRKYVNEIKAKAQQMILDRDTDLFKTVAFSKPLSEYKAMPQNIKGMLVWNLFESDEFRTGMRGTLYPIKSIITANTNYNDPERLKKYDEMFGLQEIKSSIKKFQRKPITSIVVPEGKTLPSYYIIDNDSILNFAINDRVDILLEPITKKQKTKIMTW